MAEEPTTEVPQETMEAEAAVVTTEAAEAAPTTPSEPPKPQEDPHYEVRHAPLRSFPQHCPCRPLTPNFSLSFFSCVSVAGRLRGGRGGADLRPAHAPVLAHSAILGEHCGHPVGKRFDNFGENEARGPRGVARILPLEEQPQNEKVEMGFGNNGEIGGDGGRVPWYEDCRI